MPLPADDHPPRSNGPRLVPGRGLRHRPTVPVYWLELELKYGAILRYDRAEPESRAVHVQQRSDRHQPQGHAVEGVVGWVA